MINPVKAWTAKGVTDGLPKTILAAEFLSGKGPSAANGNCSPSWWWRSGPSKPRALLGLL